MANPLKLAIAVISRISTGTSLTWRGSRYFFLAVSLILGVKALISAFQTLSPPLAFGTDFFQDYLLARALRAGLDPYQPLSELVRTFSEADPSVYFSHPSPHTFASALFVLPLTILPLSSATAVWLVIQLSLLLLSAKAILSYLNKKSASSPTAVIFALILAGSKPFFWCLTLGQFSILLLFFCCLLLGHFRESTFKPGILLGLCLVTKLFGWPILVYYLLKRKVKPVVAALGVMLLFSTVHILLFGWTNLKDYYTHILPSVSSQYLESAMNQSVFTLGHRLFRGTVVAPDLIVAPAVSAPQLAKIFHLVFPAVFLILGLYAALKAKEQDVAFSILLTLSAVISPIAWTHGFPVLLVSLSVAFTQLRSANFPPALSVAALLAASTFYAGGFFQTVIGDHKSLSFAASITTFLPMLAVLLLAVVLFKLDSITEPEAAVAHTGE